jgi:hypothetical protein
VIHVGSVVVLLGRTTPTADPIATRASAVDDYSADDRSWDLAAIHEIDAMQRGFVKT